MEYSSPVNKNEIMNFEGEWVELEKTQNIHFLFYYRLLLTNLQI